MPQRLNEFPARESDITWRDSYAFCISIYVLCLFITNVNGPERRDRHKMCFNNCNNI